MGTLDDMDTDLELDGSYKNHRVEITGMKRVDSLGRSGECSDDGADAENQTCIMQKKVTDVTFEMRR